MKYVTGFTGFSGVAAEQKGYFLAIHAESTDATTITLELLNGKSTGAKTLDSDGDMVIQITDKTKQKIKIVASDGTNTTTRIYALDNLSLVESA
ncbi:MAG: hypothetical protein KBT46_08945 [Ruminococcus sp.]|nr:hypothetical protein [Candidatus Copronaster equi]